MTYQRRGLYAERLALTLHDISDGLVNILRSMRLGSPGTIALIYISLGRQMPVRRWVAADEALTG